MFTGIVEGQGHVVSIVPAGQAFRFVVEVGPLAEGVAVGDSVALDGTCLTAVSVRSSRVEFDVVQETVERTAFAQVRVGDRVNVERAMPVNGRVHGHFVSGHVDGTARIVEKRAEARQTWVTVEGPRELCANMIYKGSVTLDGVSLTLAAVTPTTFSVAVIPHTLAVTTLGHKSAGSLVNVEVDMIGKWIRKIVGEYLAGGGRLEPPTAAAPQAAPTTTPGGVVLPSESIGLTFEALRRYGIDGSP